MKELMPMFIALLAGIVTASGWVVTYYLTKRKEDRVRRIENTIKYLERQIQEFYGPLFNLVHQIVICNHVQHSLIYSGRTPNISADDRAKIEQFFQEKYFIPLHEEMIRILKTKLYLIDGIEMPDSFYTYLRHSTQEQVQRALWNGYHIDTSHVRGIPYPNELYQDVKSGLDSVMLKYEQCLKSLEVKDGV
jgi:hypothetical protein